MHQTEPLGEYQQERGIDPAPLILPSALDAVPTLVFIKDRDLRIISANRAVFDLLGLPREQVIGSTASELSGETGDCEKEDAEVVRTGIPSSGTLRSFDLPSGTRWYLGHKTPVKDEAGKVTGLVGTLTDVTEQVRLQEALRDSEARLKYLTDHMADIIWTMDLTFHTTYVSPSVERILGFTPEERCTQSLEQMVAPESRQRILEALQVELAREAAGNADPDRSVTVDVEYYHKDGSTVWLQNVVKPMRDDAGRVVGMLGVSRDFTELRRARIELEKSEASMRELAAYLQNIRERERTNLARDLHDQLGQGLTALKLDLHLLRLSLDNQRADSRHRLERIIAMVDGLSNDVRTLSVELRPGMLDDLGLCAAIEWQVDQFSERTGLSCSLDLDCDGQRLPATCSTALFRALQEALRNIARHANARSARVSLKELPGAVVLTVSDDGRGIHDDEIRSPQSLGLLGMAERIRLLCGTLDITGAPDKGTTLTISLPLPQGD